MTGITLEQAQQHLQVWLDADMAVAKGQSYTIGTRRLDRAQASEIRKNLDYWRREVARLSRGSNGGMRVRYGIVG